MTDEEFHRLGQILNEIQTLRWKDVDGVVAALAVDRVMARAADQDVGLIRRFTEVGHLCLLLAHPGICSGGRAERRRSAIPFY